MYLTKFSAIMMKMLHDFTEDWQMKSKKNPANWPMNMPLEEWHDHFGIFLSESEIYDKKSDQLD